MANINLQCQVCNNGILKKNKKYRLGTPLVVIGYIFLIPSICAFFIALLLILSAFIGAPKNNADINTGARGTLEQANIPQPLIEKFMNHKSISYQDKNKLTRQQRQILHDAKGTQLKGQFVNGAAVGILGVLSVVMIVGSIFGVVIGALLTIKKKVLQCSECEAIVNAS